MEPRAVVHEEMSPLPASTAEQPGDSIHGPVLTGEMCLGRQLRHLSFFFATEPGVLGSGGPRACVPRNVAQQLHDEGPGRRACTCGRQGAALRSGCSSARPATR